MDNTSSIHHFRHPHPLSLTKFYQKGRRCGMCQLDLDSATIVYNCKKCNFFLHKSCAQFQQRIIHPFHPQHTLLYLQESPYIKNPWCDVCGDNYAGCIYHCEDSECDFDLDLGCAALFPTNKYADKQAEVQKKHQHTLFVCEKPKVFFYFCGRCCEEFEKDDDLIYACLDCNCLLDEACVDQGSVLRDYPFHPEHPLTLQPPDFQSWIKCSICSGKCCDADFFQCAPCGFNLDIDCVRLKPTRTNCNSDEGLVRVQPVIHPHPLIQCDAITNFQSFCYYCGMNFPHLIYLCVTCRILVHKSCADLPPRIAHPFHPQHHLTLLENNSDVSENLFLSCGVCCITQGSFIYGCRECKVGLDIKCAWRKFPRIISEAHKHALAYVDIWTYKFKCNICKSNCDKYYFRCVECDFNIHDYCLPSLPKTIRHDCHCDPLTFTTTPIKDMLDEDEDAEFYCNACEERRELHHPTYICEGCHFVAHVHCVISEIIPCMKRRYADASDSGVSSIKLESTVNAANENESTLVDASAAVKTEEDKDPLFNKLNRDIERIQREMDTLAAKLEELEDRRMKHIASAI